MLVRGDRVLAEPAAARLAAAIGREWGIEPRTLLHPERLDDLVADLRTMALFEPGKIVVAVESGLCADREAAATLLEQIREALPFDGGADDLVGAARAAARRLLQLLRLFDVDPAASPPESALAVLPAALLTAGKGKTGAEETRGQLEPLLAAALAAGLKGIGEGELSLVADLLRDGLPARHLLILVESAAAGGHPLVDALGERGALVEAGRLSTDSKGTFDGLEELLAELRAATGTGIERDAAQTLARRTLRSADAWRGSGGIDADSAARFRAEYVKLASLSPGPAIDLELVEKNVEDRGEEALWPLLNDVRDGDAASAWSKVRRRLAGAEDPLAERLILFGRLAKLAREIVEVAGAATVAGIPTSPKPGKKLGDEDLGKLKEALEARSRAAWAKVKPFPLSKLYSAAARFTPGELARLPSRVLETELRLKGESDDPDSALAVLVLALAGVSSRAPAAAAGSRPRA